MHYYRRSYRKHTVKASGFIYRHIDTAHAYQNERSVGAAVKESIANGYGGRIHLMAYNSKPPTIFYYKSGLKFLNNEKDKLMQKYLSTPAAQRGELPKNLQSGLMYLPKENIKKLLAL